MANKLKSIFSDEIFPVSQKIRFRDQESYEKFLKALELVYREGVAQKVEGVTSIITEAKSGGGVYPITKSSNVSDVEVLPAVEDFTLDLDTEFGRKKMRLNRYFTQSSVILQTLMEAIVSFKLEIKVEEHKLTLSYQAQPEKAKTIQEIIEEYTLALAFLNYSFKEENVLLSEDIEMRKNIISTKLFFEKSLRQFKKISFLEKKLGITIAPGSIVDDIESQKDAEELYFILKENKAIRINTKSVELNELELHLQSKDKEIEIGSTLEFTFTNCIEYTIFGNKIVLHTANLLTNAIVKEVQTAESGKMKMIYSGEDIRPMYIAYKGYLTEEAAEKEMRSIMQHKKEYTEALTLYEYISMIP